MHKDAHKVISECVPLFRYCKDASDFETSWDAYLPVIKAHLKDAGAPDTALAQVKMAARESVGL